MKKYIKKNLLPLFPAVSVRSSEYQYSCGEAQSVAAQPPYQQQVNNRLDGE